MLILSIMALESARSIRFLYEHFLSRITEKSLTAFYYARYTKQNLVSIVDEYPNLDLIGNARIGTVGSDTVSQQSPPLGARRQVYRLAVFLLLIMLTKMV